MALEDALKDYDGTIITVSHDRYFLDRLVSKIIFMEEGNISLYDGNYTKFEEKRREEKTRKKASEKVVPDKSKSVKKNSSAVKIKSRKIEEVEREIIGIEAELKILESDMSDPEKYSDFKTVNEMNLRYDEMNGRLSALYDEWNKCSEK
jgi:ATP-binding cassette subfamily F protein 3